jgi:hypothetical protein
VAVQPLLLRFRYIDNDMTTSPCQINFPSSIDPSTLLSQASLWRALFDALSSAVCIGYDVVVRETTDTPPNPGVASSVKRSGAFVFDTNTATLTIMRVPSIRNDLILTSGIYAGIGIDLADSDVSAFTDAMIYGLSGIHPSDPFGIDIVALSNGIVEQY